MTNCVIAPTAVALRKIVCVGSTDKRYGTTFDFNNIYYHVKYACFYTDAELYL